MCLSIFILFATPGWSLITVVLDLLLPLVPNSKQLPHGDSGTERLMILPL